MVTIEGLAYVASVSHPWCRDELSAAGQQTGGSRRLLTKLEGLREANEMHWSHCLAAVKPPDCPFAKPVQNMVRRLYPEGI